MKEKHLLALAIVVSVCLLAATVAVQQVRADDCADTYENFGKGFMEKYCNSCHSAKKSNMFSRKGAPKGYDFDTVEDIKKHKAEILEYTIDNKKMPPFGDKPTEDELKKLKNWLDCEYKK